MMKVSVYLNILKTHAVIGDAEDEYAPLVKIEFCSEMRDLSDEKKLKVAQAVIDELNKED